MTSIVLGLPFTEPTLTCPLARANSSPLLSWRLTLLGSNTNIMLAFYGVRLPLFARGNSLALCSTVWRDCWLGRFTCDFSSIWPFGLFPC
ncbi:hypothetical protein BOTBODRAFT_419670 [Botryobasidium botryosum FD-172 SS1]|uniref:Uncharacterized protein n=1 Tax=Botryobasidium botryosum (strain FD-172 SS1) TaxID=930990 RepID=A0A067ML40_BOTB1|nr:hypothetical protein BOTBODRAFT_419670 [Botryobasidium botryosum FD-172 SS1]